MAPRILITHTGGGLGDLLLSTPIASALHRRFPGAVIDYWAGSACAPILENHPSIARVWTTDDASPWRQLHGWLRDGRYDVAILPWTTTRQAWLIAAAEIERRVGPANRIKYSHLFTDRIEDHWAHDDDTMHVVEMYLEYAAALGCETDGLVPRIHLSAEEEEEARELLVAAGCRPDERLCLVHVARGMDTSARRWPIDRFAEAGRRIASDAGCRLVTIGTSGERELAERLCSQAGNGAINLAGRTTLRQACAVIAHCALVVTLDTGPMHIAAALGVPVVAIFPMACYPIWRWKPVGAPARVVTTKDWQCPRRCVKETCPDFECHNHVDPEAVVVAAQWLLRGGATG